MELIRAETRKDGKLVHDLSITNGDGLFPEACLIRECDSDGEIYASETVTLLNVERVADEDLRMIEIEPGGSFWDRRSNPPKRISAADFLQSR